MIDFFSWLDINENQNQAQTVTGPGIKAMQSTLRDMAARGVPNVDNDYGFNKTDWNTYHALLASGHIDSISVPVGVAATMLRMLSHYRNTQIQNYQQISDMVSKDMSSVQGQTSGDKVIVYDKQPLEYGKVKVYVPHGVDRSITMAINKLADAALESEGAERTVDNYGNSKLPRFKKFSSDKSGLHVYRIHKGILPQVVEVFKSKGMQVEYESGSSPTTPQQASASTSPQAAPKARSEEIEIIGTEDTDFGKKLAVRFNVAYERSKATFDAIKAAGLTPRGMAYKSGPSRFLINIDDPKLFSSVRAELDKQGYDTTSLEEFARENTPQQQPAATSTGGERLVRFTDDQGQKIRIRVNYGVLTQGRKDFLKESIQYTFPDYEWNRDGFYYTVSGSYKQYVSFGRLLSRFGYDVSELRSVVKKKMDDGRLGKTAWEGRHDDDEDFLSKIEERLPESKFDLYDEQKRGIAFLYGRDHAILGDETGLGKCLLPGSWIQTSEGIFDIEQIWNTFSKNSIINDVGEEWAKLSSDLYVHSMTPDEKIVKSKVIGLYREKISTFVKEIHTSNNRKIKSTIPHKFYTDIGWNSDISPGDFICSSPNQPSLKTNDFTDLNLAEILAWQIAEGWENSKRASVRIYQKDLLILQRIQVLLAEKNISSKVYKKDSCSFIGINSKEYKNLLESMGYEWGNKSATKVIPEFIMNAGEEVVKTFLKAFFDAECYVNPNLRQIEVTTASEAMARQIQTLLWRFGIFCVCHEKYKMATNGHRISRKYQSIYVCGSSVSKFFDIIGLGCKYKTNSFFNISTKPNPNKEGKPIHRIIGPFFNKYNVPTRLLKVPSKLFITGQRMATNRIIAQILSAFEKVKSGEVLSDYMMIKKSKWTEKTLSALRGIKEKDVDHVISGLRQMLDNDLYYEKVVKVERIKYDGYVYDLCVENYQNYISNGLICHNTVQLISAAALKMQDNDNKPTLIITLKSTQKQWIEEIVNVMGDNERTNISADPLQPKKWTVLYYENFSSGKRLEEAISKLSKTSFGAVIFDELHKVKHSKSKRSQNIAKVVESIPTKWGASATVSSNKPMDVRNQLTMTGHHLGRVSESKFKRDFAGMVGGGYGGSLQKSDNDEDEIRAAERLNKWLNLSGVYVRRSKADIRQMPNISVDDKAAAIDQDHFQQIFSSNVSGYKDPELPISRLIAAREAIAQLKTDKTTNEVIRIVNEGKDKPPAASKVVVFSNFIVAGRKLAEKIDAELKKIDPNFHVITYLSDTKKAERDKVKSKFTNDPNAKVLVMSMKMGGTGIDFPNAAQNMVINDFDWTPESAEQSEGRIYRINTDHPVKIQYIVGEGLDRDLFSRVKKKREIAAIIQRYRKDYHDAEHDPEVLKKIVDAQKEIKKIDKEMQAAVAAHIPGAEAALASESFKDYLQVIEEYWGS